MKRNKEQCTDILHEYGMHFVEKDGKFTVYRDRTKYSFDNVGELSAFVEGFIAGFDRS